MKLWKALCGLALIAALCVTEAGAFAQLPEFTHDHNLAEEQFIPPEGAATRGDCAGYLAGFVARQLGWDAEDLVSYMLEVHPERFPDAGAKADVLRALSISQGRGDGTFGPDSPLTRQEAAVFLARTYSAYGGELPKGDVSAFLDAEQIAPWAEDSVGALAAMGIFQGCGDGRFAPTEPFTHVQCVTTLERLWNNAPVSRKNGNVKPVVTYDEYMAYVDKLDADAKENNYGTYQVYQADGAQAGFLQLIVGGGTMSQHTRCQLVFRNGGVRTLYDLGVCDTGWGGLTAGAQLSEGKFSEDGKTFTCVMTLDRDVEGMGATHSHAAGRYQIVIDVETLAATAERL